MSKPVFLSRRRVFLWRSAWAQSSAETLSLQVFRRSLSAFRSTGAPAFSSRVARRRTVLVRRIAFLVRMSSSPFSVP
ncbi:MAG: hypothetical protein A2V74_03415 [Acidobacteria bacterium RBG_16_70_10]|nr:MAG: hypothetical protein A2V74_03415 [Acidobacteria bacterium RBG_16_70_10]